MYRICMSASRQIEEIGGIRCDGQRDGDALAGYREGSGILGNEIRK